MTIGFGSDVRGFERPRKARPSCSGVVLVERAEERLAGNDVDINPGLVVVEVRIAERPLRRVGLGDSVLDRRELLFQLRFTRLHEFLCGSARGAPGGLRGCGRGRNDEKCERAKQSWGNSDHVGWSPGVLTYTPDGHGMFRRRRAR